MLPPEVTRRYDQARYAEKFLCLQPVQGSTQRLRPLTGINGGSLGGGQRNGVKPPLEKSGYGHRVGRHEKVTTWGGAKNSVFLVAAGKTIGMGWGQKNFFIS